MQSCGGSSRPSVVAVKWRGADCFSGEARDKGRGAGANRGGAIWRAGMIVAREPKSDFWFVLWDSEMKDRLVNATLVVLAAGIPALILVKLVLIFVGSH